MLRSILVVLALGVLCTSQAWAGDCGCGHRNPRPIGYSLGHHGWNGYKMSGCDSGCKSGCGAACDSCDDACADPCSSCRHCKGHGCGHCCFPLLRGAAHAVGKVINFVIPRPCCRSGCSPCGPSCGDTCGWDPTGCTSCGADATPIHHGPAADPFQDDPAPTPVPTKEARNSVLWKAPVAVKSSPAMPRTMVQKQKPTLATKPTTKPVKLTTPARNVMKIAHDEQVDEQIEQELASRLAQDDGDQIPVAPSSIRLVGHDDQREATSTSQTTRRTTNPLR